MANILLVEDDPIALRATGTLLTKANHEVVFARDGKEAFEKLDKHDFDAIVTDILMPYANGLEIVSRLRNEKGNGKMIIVVVSSVGDADMLAEATKLGADDYLVKPIAPMDLIARLNKLLKSKLVAQ